MTLAEAHFLGRRGSHATEKPVLRRTLAFTLVHPNPLISPANIRARAWEISRFAQEIALAVSLHPVANPKILAADRRAVR